MLNLSSCRSSKLPAASTSSGITARAQEVNQSFYELDRPAGNPSMQLLFFHGLQFQNFTNVHFSTWESGDGSCIWPQEWLVEEFPSTRVLFASYDGRVGKRFRESVFDMEIIGENLVSDLMHADVGQVPGCPVILVGHSVGGLVIKQVCYEAHKRLNLSRGLDKDKLQNFFNNLHGIFFYATPHCGSPIAEKAVDLCGGPLMNYFKILNKEAARLDNTFSKLCRMYPKVQIEGVGESKPTKLGTLGEVFIVPEASSRRDDFNVVDGVDHFTVCKPMTKIKRSFYKLQKFLFNILENMTAQGTPEIPENFQFVPEYVVGIDGSKQKIIQKLANIANLGLVGMGGVGKTTLAKAIFNSMSQQFEYSCFVPDVKLIKGTENDLKEELWKHIYHHGKKIASGKNWLNLRGKKFLLVLDGISNDRDGMVMSELAQLTASESRFIMTSRDKNLVHNWGDIYEVPFLNQDSARKLFQSFAFPGYAVPPRELGGIMKAVVEKCDGLPLTLGVLGKYLKGKLNYDDWKQTFHALDEAENVKDMNSRLWAKLRPSYESLGDKEQQMFLDATTFFVTSNWTLGEALAAWTVAYETTSERILWQTLVDMSLVYQVGEDEYIKVHEQLQSLGCKIASEVNYDNKRRDGNVGPKMIQTGHLFHGKEFYALRLVYQFANIEDLSKLYLDGIVTGRFSEISSEICVNIPSSAFLNLKKLRFLEVDVPVRIDGAEEVASIPTELVLLKCFGQNLFNPALQKRLAVLEINDLEHLPSSIGELSYLKYFTIARSQKLCSLPESFGRLASLRHLYFVHCLSLQVLPKSFGELKALQHLEFFRCPIQTLPESFGGLSSLISLKFHFCEKLHTLPESLGELSSLNQLEIFYCGDLRTLPDSFGGLSSLKYLAFDCLHNLTLPESFGSLSSLIYLDFYRWNLCTLPDSFGRLSSLNHIAFSQLDELHTLPDSFGRLSSLNHLEFFRCPIQSLPESFGGLSSLNSLIFHECHNLCTLPDSFGGLFHLNSLKFHECQNLYTLPDSLGGLYSLNHLLFDHCDNLHTLPESFGRLSSLNHLGFINCEILRSLPESFGGLSALNHLEFISCWNLHTLPDSFGRLSSLNHLEFFRCPIQSLPESFGRLSSLNSLKFHECYNLCTLPDSFGELSSLNHLVFNECSRLHTLPGSFGGLSTLKYLSFESCPNLHALPESFWQLSLLEKLEMDCDLDTLPESFGQLTKLQWLDIKIDGRIPSSLGDLKDLQYLAITSIGTSSIPDGIKCLPSLQILVLHFGIDPVESLPPWLTTPNFANIGVDQGGTVNIGTGSPSKIVKDSFMVFKVQDGCFSHRLSEDDLRPGTVLFSLMKDQILNRAPPDW